MPSPQGVATSPGAFLRLPACQSLSPWERWHGVSRDGEGKPGTKEPLRSDKHWLLIESPYRCVFVLSQHPCPLSRACARQGRVAAPSVCFAVACILLAAAPTAPPCFRHWRRSSPLPPKGEPLAGRATSYWTPEARYGAKGRALLQRAAASGQAHLVKLP